MNECFMACRRFIEDFVPQDRREVRIDLDDSFAVAAELEKAGEVVFAVVFNFAMRSERIDAYAKLSFMSTGKGLIASPAFDDGGVPVPAALLARVKQLRGSDRDEIGTLLPMALAELHIGLSDLASLQDRLSCFAMESLLEAWAVLPALLHLNTTAKVLECAQASSGADAPWPHIGLSRSMTHMQLQASTAGSATKH
jgi:hypothetical protein